jgi:hypothetical protein
MKNGEPTSQTRKFRFSRDVVKLPEWLHTASAFDISFAQLKKVAGANNIHDLEAYCSNACNSARSAGLCHLTSEKC